MELIEGELAEPLTFKRYPKSDMYLIMLRNRVNMKSEIWDGMVERGRVLSVLKEHR